MILYKYYPCNEFTFRALSELGFWCSPASNMNDPFDCLGQLMKEEDVNIEDYQTIKNVGDRGEISICSEKLLKNQYFKFCKKIIELHSFCSFTDDCLNILMWSYYANAHQGIVIGIEIPYDVEKDMYRVGYQNKLPDFNLDNFNQLLSRSTNPSDYNIDMFRPIIQNISTKIKDWEHEKEWRFWAKNKSEYVHYGTEGLKAVYFGVRCPQETMDKVKSILRGHGVSDNVYHNIRIETDPEIRLTI